MFFIVVHVTFFSSRCMLELKFAIYYRAASLPSQDSYAVLSEESQASFKHSPHTNSISNSAILHNNYISLVGDLWACVYMKKKGVVKEAIVLQWAVQSPRVTSNLEKSNGLVHCSVKNAAVLCEYHCERVMRIWTIACLKKEERRRKKNISPVLRVPGLVPLWCFLTPLGVLLAMKTLDNEWYVVIKAYKLEKSLCIVIYCTSALSLH